MNNNIFFNNNQKFNPDIQDKLNKKKHERQIKYELKNIVDKPIITTKINKDMPVDLKKREHQLKQEREKLDSELLNKNRNIHYNLPISNINNVENITRPRSKKSLKKADKILNDLKKLGIIK